MSWFAVGCYYLMVGHKNEHARRYLRYVQKSAHFLFVLIILLQLYILIFVSCSKATTLERTYGPAWIAYGHSFAVESEHDQAMAAYFTAAQLMKGLVDFLALSPSLLSVMVLSHSGQVHCREMVLLTEARPGANDTL